MTTSSSSFQPVLLIPIVLAVLVFIAYQFLPFVHQPELGATTIPTLTETRGNNEVGLTTNGLALIPFAALVLLFLGLWNLTNAHLSRATAALTALAGVVMLEYFAVFALDYRAEAATYLGQMGVGFWAILGLGVLMLAQVAVPRPAAPPEFSLRNLAANQESAILIALALLLIVVGLNNPRFLATRNLLDVLSGNAYIAVAAIGMSMLIITGNIDISVGSLIGLLAVISGRLVVGGAPIWVAWLAPLVIGALVGALIGFIVTYLRVPSIVVTLGMFSILKGALILWTSGQRVTGMPDGFYLAQTKPFGVPMPIVFMLVLTLLAALWMWYSPAGRTLYAVGGNAAAARLSGISATRVVIMAFVLKRGVRRLGKLALRDAVASHPGDAAARARAVRHHRGGRGRREHFGRQGHRHRRDARRDFAQHDSLRHGVRERVALLDSGGAGRADSRHRFNRPAARKERV